MFSFSYRIVGRVCPSVGLSVSVGLSGIISKGEKLNFHIPIII